MLSLPKRDLLIVYVSPGYIYLLKGSKLRLFSKEKTVIDCFKGRRFQPDKEENVLFRQSSHHIGIWIQPSFDESKNDIFGISERVNGTIVDFKAFGDRFMIILTEEGLISIQNYAKDGSEVQIIEEKQIKLYDNEM